MNTHSATNEVQLASKPLLAYSVLEKYEMTGDIFFATKAIYAAKAGANEFADGELGGVQCRRAPWADTFAGKGIPAKVAIAHGWHFECSGCGRRLDDDIEDTRGLKLSGVRGTTGSAVYCCEKCEKGYLRNEKQRKAEAEAAIRDFRAIVSARFPTAVFSEDDSGIRGDHAYVTRPGRSGSWNREQVVVSFGFPGMEIGPATFRMDRYHRIGPPKAGYTCCNGDRSAFEAYVAATKKA